MGGAAVTRPTVDYRDVQGLVRFGYKHLKAARYAVVGVKNLAAARAWLRQAPVTNAEYVQPPPSSALHVALTAAGLAALGVPAAVRAAFSPEFLGGMADVNRARRLRPRPPKGSYWGGDGAGKPACRTCS